MKCFLVAIFFQVTAHWALKIPLHQSLSRTDDESSLEGEGVAVCITGQVARLVPLGKVENLFEPLQQLIRNNVNVFSALQAGKAVFVNQPKQKRRTQNLVKELDLGVHLRNLFGNFHHSLVSLEHEDHRSKAAQMLKMLPKYGKDKPKLNRTVRLAKHLSQWTGWSECMKLVKMAEMKRERNYRLLIRIRDSTIILRNTTSIDFREGNGVKVKECQSWNGVNDKGAIVAREYAEQYMEGPLKFVNNMLAQKVTQEHILNPEQILKAVLDKQQVPVIRVSADDMPFVCALDVAHLQDEVLNKNENIKMKNDYCLVPHWKDCHPATPWTGRSLNTCRSDPHNHSIWSA